MHGQGARTGFGGGPGMKSMLGHNGKLVIALCRKQFDDNDDLMTTAENKEKDNQMDEQEESEE